LRVWIAENNLGYHNDDDCAALVNMQEYRKMTESVLLETTRSSVQHIWREEIKPIVDRLSTLRQVTKTPSEPPPPPEPPIIAAPAVKIDEPPPGKPQIEPEQNPKPPSKETPGRKCPGAIICMKRNRNDDRDTSYHEHRT
jgi:hypothetical protein